MNELVFYNNLNNSIEEGREEKEIKNKKNTIKTYKFHMLHHNGLLNTLKKTGININSINNIFNKNESLFIELLKNNNENFLKKSFSEINIQNNKNIINKNDNSRYNPNSINIVKSYYESYGKNTKQIQIKNLSQFNKENQNQEMKIKYDSKRIKRNSIFSLNSLNSNRIKIKKRFSIDSNKQYNNSLNESNSYRLEESKTNLKGKKRRASVQLLPNKVYLSIDEDNSFNNDEQLQRNEKMVKLRENNKLNNNVLKLPINNIPQKSSKRSNSTITHVSNYSNNNNYYIQNNDNIFKSSLPTFKRYNKIFYLNNNKKPHYKFKRNNSYHPYFIKGSVNFKKMLSRAYLDRISNHVENIYSTITPNYLAIIIIIFHQNLLNSKKWQVEVRSRTQNCLLL